MIGELRQCACGRIYTLPLPYDAANTEIRDLCPDCLSKEQWKRMNRSSTQQ
jgi:hypothetical protein